MGIVRSDRGSDVTERRERKGTIRNYTALPFPLPLRPYGSTRHVGCHRHTVYHSTPGGDRVGPLVTIASLISGVLNGWVTRVRREDETRTAPHRTAPHFIARREMRRGILACIGM